MLVPVVFPSNTPERISGASGLVALRDDGALAGTAARQVGDQVLYAQGQPRRAPVDDDEVAGTVRFAGSGDAERLPEAVARHLAEDRTTRAGSAAGCSAICCGSVSKTMSARRMQIRW